MKRLFDIIVALIGLIFLSPFLLILALIIKLESQGPVFYRGERVGRNGKIFRIYKFRSMIVDAEKVGGSSTSEADPRVTKIGAKIRKYKIDELPQLMNVLFGEMSLVGPRPQVKWAVDRFSDQEKKLLILRPGITDWASIKYRNEGEIIAQSGIADPDEAYLKLIHPGKMELELKYLAEHSFWVDLQIIFQTFTSVLSARSRNE